MMSSLYWSTNALTLRGALSAWSDSQTDTYLAIDLNPIDLAGASCELEPGAEDVAELGIGNAGGVRISPRTSEIV